MNRLVASGKIFSLRLIEDPETSFALSPGPNLIGSDPCNHLVLGLEGVSPRHALLKLEPGSTALLVDRQSEEGTFVNGRRISRTALRLGDEVSLGPVRLRLEARGPEETELAVTLDNPTAATGEDGGQRGAGEATASQKSSGQGLLTASRSGRWLRILRELFDALHRLEGGEASEALALVSDQLEAEGACLAEIGRDGEPVFRAISGALRPQAVDRLCSRWRREGLLGSHEGADERGRFVSLPEVTGTLAPCREGWCGLLVFGDFPGRRQSGELLAAVLAMMRHFDLAPRRVPGEAEESPAPSGLTLPSEYVRASSAAMAKVYRQLELLATSRLPVVLLGETGVGKEQLAQALHLSSKGGKAPFEAVSCAGIPAEDLEEELFGNGKAGRIHDAEGGTLFLDEIGDLPIAVQRRLLGVLDSGKSGSSRRAPFTVDVRFVGSTNADVDELMEGRQLRRDFYYRLAGSVVEVPPLRERPGDLATLVEVLLERFSRQTGKRVLGVTTGAYRALSQYPWPGNVLELEHEILRVVHLCPDGRPVDLTMLSNRIQAAATESEEGSDDPRDPTLLGSAGTALSILDLETLEQRALREALRRTDGNQAAAARLLGISRHALRRRLERYDLKP